MKLETSTVRLERHERKPMSARCARLKPSKRCKRCRYLGPYSYSIAPDSIIPISGVAREELARGLDDRDTAVRAVIAMMYAIPRTELVAAMFRKPRVASSSYIQEWDERFTNYGRAVAAMPDDMLRRFVDVAIEWAAAQALPKGGA